MSIAFLADKSQSKITKDDLKDIAANLNITIQDGPDAEAYLLLLQSMEAVMQRIENSTDYIHPSLSPVSTAKPREYWLPRDRNEQNPLNAWRHRCELVASKPTSRLLQGRTIAIKDNISIGGLPTTLGTFTEILCRDGKLPISPIDASVVSRILEAGAIIKGSSNCENFCASPLSYSAATGPVHSPWLHGYTTGGSSSGSAALASANIVHRQTQTENKFGLTVDLAIGGDQAGSIRIPASFTGIYGLKPTHGLIPYTGAVGLAPMIDHLGPLAERLEDIALLLQVMAGYDGIDPRMTPESPLRNQVPDYPEQLSQFRSRPLADGEGLGTYFKIGLISESFDIPGLTTQVRDTVLQSSKKYFTQAGASVSEVSIPMHREGIVIWTAASRPSTSEWACQGKPGGFLTFPPPHIHTQWPPDQKMYEILTATNPALINIIFNAPFINQRFGPMTEAKAYRKVFELRAAYDRAFEEFDVLVTPCTPSVAMPHPKMCADTDGPASSIMDKVNVAVGVTTNTAPFNVTGHPAMSVPCGFGSVSERPDVKLPIGMQVIGKRWDEMSVFKAAAIFEEGRRLAGQ
ncbi:amidase, putative [Talaromyces stipitatus ATCC 10500]|uniref:Amidase, putative n=1 Tax=Talaromyces stipitatus (strain ATCC 10500 / CBS 375.48 / QM 6759 / NRRL 1006) TaxID=441959 RepID=B8MA27_TALSN|nr:amidase, putative [Talaromyces stipitatus ATCC 10500]EED18356.1 amidase, putative [Talaromyces stipitatus ATCC 10500]